MFLSFSGSFSCVALTLLNSHCSCLLMDSLRVPSLHHAAAGEREPQKQWQVISVSHEGVTITFRALITRLQNWGPSAHNNTSFVKRKHNVISTVNAIRTWINNFDWIMINNTQIYLYSNLPNFGSTVYFWNVNVILTFVILAVVLEWQAGGLDRLWTLCLLSGWHRHTHPLTKPLCLQHRVSLTVSRQATATGLRLMLTPNTGVVEKHNLGLIHSFSADQQLHHQHRSDHLFVVT